MKNVHSISILITALLLNACSTTPDHTSNSDLPPLVSHYFGERPPGRIPQLFDPKIVSPEGRFDHGSFTPDMKAFYFTRKHGKYKKKGVNLMSSLDNLPNLSFLIMSEVT